MGENQPNEEGLRGIRAGDAGTSRCLLRWPCDPLEPAPFSMKNVLLVLGATLALTACDPAGPAEATLDSGGPLRPEQAAFDVTFYDLALRIDPADSTLAGSLTADARIVHPTARLVLDLDARLVVQTVRLGAGEAAVARPFERRGGRIWIDLGGTRQPGETVRVTVDYGGRPRVAPQPPWQGGFTWARTPDGAPWIATTVQREGADVWWPVKDHVSDEPDSMALHFTVPRPLVAASNGRLRRVEDHADEWRTYHWFVSTPINVYNVTLAAAPYQPVETDYTSITGESLPVIFYVLPEDRARGKAFLPEILDHLRFFETTLGPYPFRADKYGVVQTPHLGMEHQTLIAYGAAFDNGAMTGGRDFGFDALHHHELAHEWWGNLVTNADWRDMWLHEGFATYMQALYAEQRGGRAAPAGQHREPACAGAARVPFGVSDLRRRYLREGGLGAAHAPVLDRGGGAAHGPPALRLSGFRPGEPGRRMPRLPVRHDGGLRADRRANHGTGPGVVLRGLRPPCSTATPRRRAGRRHAAPGVDHA